MIKENKFTIGALVFAILVIGVIGFTNRAPVVNNVIEQPVGSMPGSELFTPSFKVNGVEQFYFSSALNKASTTLCTFKAPSATSTLVFASLTLTTGTTTTIQVEIGKSILVAATTTSFGTVTLAANQKATIIASTTQASSGSGNGVIADPPTVFSPSHYLNFKYGGAIGTTNVLIGTCKAIFIKN